MDYHKPVSVIIADDHPSVRYGLRSILESLDFVKQIDDAKDGNEVLSILSFQPYDLILIDIRMPNLDGIETTKLILSRYPDTKIIALSMHSEERYVIEMMNAGCSAYVLKNAEKEEIFTAIKRALDGDRYLSKEFGNELAMKIISDDTPATKRKQRHEEDLREIIFLLCYEKTSADIADILFFSKRTVERYRLEINDKISTKNLAGIVKYAIDNGIYHDLLLNSKFSKIITDSSTGGHAKNSAVNQ
jgi:DNA-binding NarL/FixJ family response regulator